jgi:hypothetical protein
MEEVVLKVKVEGSGDSEAKIKTVKQQLREAKEAALQAKEGTEEYFQALQKAAGLADQLKDVNEAVNTLDPGAKAQAFGTLINSVAGGFQTITGLYGLLGQKSEEVEKLLLKVQSASALAMGVQSLVEAGKQWNVLKTVVLDFYDSIKKAGTATQLGLIGIAATLATIIYQLATAKTETDKLIESTDEFNKTAATEISTLKQLVAVAKDENQSKANRQKAIKDINKISPKYLGDITLESIGTAKATKEINLYTEALIKKAKVQAAQEELTKRYKNLIDLQIQFSQLDSKQLSESGIKAKVVSMQYQVIGDAYRKTVKDIGTLTDMITNNSDAVTDLLEENSDKTKKTVEDNRKIIADEAKSILESRLKLIQDLDRIENEKGIKDAERKAKEIEDTKKQNQELIDQQRLAAQEAAEISDIAKKQQIQDAKDIQDAKFMIAQNTLNGLSALGELLSGNGKKNTAFQKTLAIAQIAIDTAKSIAATISGATQAAAAGGPAAPFLQVAYITSGIASVLAAMASAKKALQQPEINQVGGGGGNLNLPTASGITPPSLQPVNTSGFIQQDEQNFKVYVVESDITNTQVGVQQNKKKALITI